MGMPGSSEYLQELTSRVSGDFMQEGFLVVIVDDLFVGGDSATDLANNWSHVLQRMKECNPTLSASKTVICPLRTVILGWKWSMRPISPATYKMSALDSLDPHKTCSAMRSFIGAFKAISYFTLYPTLRVIAVSTGRFYKGSNRC